MPVNTALKPFYSEKEAARSLGVTIPQFRELVRRHIVEREEDMGNVEITTFHASDLLLLRLFSSFHKDAGTENGVTLS